MAGFELTDHHVEDISHFSAMGDAIEQGLVTVADGGPITAVEELIVELVVVDAPELVECSLALSIDIACPISAEFDSLCGIAGSAKIDQSRDTVLDGEELAAVRVELVAALYPTARDLGYTFTIVVGFEDIGTLSVDNVAVGFVADDWTSSIRDE